MENRKNTAIVLAAGRGNRMHSRVPKQYMQLGNYPVLYYSLNVFQQSKLIDKIIVVAGKEDVDYCKKEIIEFYNFDKVVQVVAGGKERYYSVFEGLKLAQGSDYVLIHDGARPFLTEDIIRRNLEAAEQYQSCITGMPVKDTIKVVDEEGFAIHTPNRSLTYIIQTPQTFRFDFIWEAYRKLFQKELEGEYYPITDDAMVVECMTGKKVKIVEGSYENIKLTTPSDFCIAELLLKKV